MAVEIDTSRALRRPSELRDLVLAIRAAGENDETDWLEWKLWLDLGRAEGRFHVARAVLGLANRLPDRAIRNCEGVGYVVVGVEPGKLVGVPPIDPAQLEDGLTPFLGSVNGPAWQPHAVVVDGASVLVVTVEPPRPGDRIAPLRRTHQDARKGTVFIRRPGKTERADDAEIDALQTRLLAGGKKDRPTLQVDVDAAVPIRWFDFSEDDEGVSAWLSTERDRLMAQARAWTSEGRQDPAPGLTGRWLTQSMALSGMQPVDEDRTVDEYIAELDAWVAEVREASFEAAFGRAFEDEANMVRFSVHNPTDQNVSAVELKVHIPGERLMGFEETPDPVDLPRPPRRYGTPPPNPLSGFDFRVPNIPIPSYDHLSPSLRRTRVEDGSINVTFDVGDLRPEETDVSDEIYIALAELPEGGVLRGTWSATTKGADGILRGDVAIPVQADPLTVAELVVPD